MENCNKPYNERDINNITQKEPIFHSPSTSYQFLSIRGTLRQRDCYNDLFQSFMSNENYEHLKLVWKTLDIHPWSKIYELYDTLDVRLLVDCFKYFYNSTMKTFGIDFVHYFIIPQMSYSLFLKKVLDNPSNNESLRNYDVFKK